MTKLSKAFLSLLEPGKAMDSMGDLHDGVKGQYDDKLLPISLNGGAHASL
jgi:hypothetical protein